MNQVTEGPVRYRVDDLVVDTGRCSVERNGDLIPLPGLSFDLLVALVRAAPNLVTIDELSARVWPGVIVSPETISQRIKLLRSALDDPAAAPRYITTVRGRGYRLCVPVEAESEEPAEPMPVATQRRPARLWVRLAIAAGLAALLAWFVGRIAESPAPDPPVRNGMASTDPSIAVLPLINRSPRPEDAIFADAVHDDLLTRLAQLDDIRVIARTSVEQFRATTLDIREIGRRLDVATVLEGSVQHDGDRIRINLQLIDAANGAHLWAGNYDRQLNAGNLFAMQSEVARAVAQELRPILDSERERLRKTPTSSLDAWQDYQAGRRLLAAGRSSALPKAQSLFERAIAHDPGFALAHAGLAETLAMRAGSKDRLDSALAHAAAASVERALQLAPDDAEVLTVSANIAGDLGDFARAEREYRRALELRPGDAWAASGYGSLLSELGRPQEGLRYLEAALRVDPYSADVLSTLGAVLQDVDRPADALASLLRVIDIEPGRANEHARIGVLFARSYGRLDLGVPWLERAIVLDPDYLVAMRWLMALNGDLGRLEDARRWRLELQGRLGDRVDSSTLVAAGEDPGPEANVLARRALDADPRDATALAVLALADFAVQRPERARRRYELAYPEWVRSAVPDLSKGRLRPALDYAETLRRTGDAARAAQIAAAAEQFLSKMPRLSPSGYQLADVRAHAVRNDVGAALAALERAEREGWRGPCWRCSRDLDFVLDAIRREPRFEAVFKRIEHDLQEQRRRLEARAPGEPLPTDPP